MQTKTKTRQIKLSLTEEEYLELSKRAKQENLTPQKYLLMCTKFCAAANTEQAEKFKNDNNVIIIPVYLFDRTELDYISAEVANMYMRASEIRDILDDIEQKLKLQKIENKEIAEFKQMMNKFKLVALNLQDAYIDFHDSIPRFNLGQRLATPMLPD